MSEGLIAIIFITFVVVMIEFINIFSNYILNKNKNNVISSDAFIVIPLLDNRLDSEYIIRDIVQKTDLSSIYYQIYVLNINGNRESLEICQKLSEDFGRVRIINDISEIRELDISLTLNENI